MTFGRVSPAIVLVAINASVFVALRICAIIMRICGDGDAIDAVLCRVMLPNSPELAVVSPWTPVTYMFVQYDAMHLLVNCLWLYLFASLLDRNAAYGRRIYALYIAGGFAGALAYLMCGATTEGLVGASASILALMGASLVAIPREKVHIPLLGDASVKIVVLIAVLLFVIASGSANYGAHVAHGGGFACGLLMALLWSRQRKISKSPVVIVPKAKRGSAVQSGTQEEPTLDDLLDKIRSSGYGALTSSEKKRLFTISSNLQKRDR